MARVRHILLAAWIALTLSPGIGAAATCGNGILEDGESCDDGNVHAGDCCSPTCQVEESYLGCAGQCLCDTCGDEIDNDGDGLVDGDDPECATLHQLHRVTVSAAEGPLASPDPTDDTEGLVCLASRPIPASDEDAETCEAAADVAAVEAEGIAELGGAALEEITIARGAPEQVLSFDSGTSMLSIDAVHLATGSRLRLVGMEDSTVVVQVKGGLVLDRGAQVVLDGDLRGERVLWNIPGPGRTVFLGAQSSLPGTLLAPERDVKLACGAAIGGGLYSRTVERASETYCRS